MAFERIHGDKAMRYMDTASGEIISRRQFDKRFGVLAQEGFSSYEARAKALASKTTDHQKVGTRHRTHILGLPQNIDRAIETVLKSSGSFGYGMYLSLEVEVYGNGRPYKQWVSSTVHRKHKNEIEDMIDEVNASIIDYGIEFVRLQYQLDIVDVIPNVSVRVKR